jgi:YVTN family beta-propeller protein
MAAPTGGVGVGEYHVFTVAPAHTAIAVRPDGNYVYVLNSQTNDITAIKTGNAEVVAKIADGGERLQMLNGGSVLAIVANKSIRRIDTATQQALPDLPSDGPVLGFQLSPDGRTAVVLTEGSVLLLDGATGELQKRIDGFKRPMTVIFAAQTADNRQIAGGSAHP